jgi:hypothetical protein
MRSVDLSTVQFLLLMQLIIFILGWPLEWSEIIVIFVDTAHTLQRLTASALRDWLVEGRVDIEGFYRHQCVYAAQVQQRLHPFASLDERVVALQARHRVSERLEVTRHHRCGACRSG